jgi:hypothetical protein
MKLRMFGGLLIAVALGASNVESIRGQARADPGWASRSPGVADLTVMIDAAEDQSCIGAGIVAGYAKGSFYVLTADHVLDLAEQSGSLDTLGVRFRIAETRTTPAIERRAPARVMRRSEHADDLAALVIESPALVNELRPMMDFKALGDSEHLVAKDSVYAIGCGDGLDWEIPADLTPLLPRNVNEAQASLLYARKYVRPGFSGGPLVHVFQSASTIVGMTLRDGGSYGRAAPIRQVLEKARSWQVPVKLTFPATRFSCRYTVSTTNIVLTGEDRGTEVMVQTGDTCPWTVRRQIDSRLLEMQSYWLDVATLDEFTYPEGTHFGPMKVFIAAGHESLCDGRRQQAVVQVAGQLIQVSYDGRCTNPPPETASIPSSRGPRFSREKIRTARPAKP